MGYHLIRVSDHDLDSFSIETAKVTMMKANGQAAEPNRQQQSILAGTYAYKSLHSAVACLPGHVVLALQRDAELHGGLSQWWLRVQLEVGLDYSSASKRWTEHRVDPNSARARSGFHLAVGLMSFEKGKIPGATSRPVRTCGEALRHHQAATMVHASPRIGEVGWRPTWWYQSCLGNDEGCVDWTILSEGAREGDEA